MGVLRGKTQMEISIHLANIKSMQQNCNSYKKLLAVSAQVLQSFHGRSGQYILTKKNTTLFRGEIIWASPKDCSAAAITTTITTTTSTSITIYIFTCSIAETVAVTR